jgi:hypothetical protein
MLHTDFYFSMIYPRAAFYPCVKLISITKVYEI